MKFLDYCNEVPVICQECKKLTIVNAQHPSRDWTCGECVEKEETKEAEWKTKKMNHAN